MTIHPLHYGVLQPVHSLKRPLKKKKPRIMRANLLGKQLSISKMLSSEKVLKCIRWTLVIGLTISAVLFTRETWVEYTKKRTSFKQYEEVRTELPTTVLCFNPFLKASVLEEYNLDFFDLGKKK